MKIAYLLFVFSFFAVVLRAQISGIVYDHNHTPLIGATVILQPDSITRITDINGAFTFEDIDNKLYSLEVRFLGMEPQYIDVRPPLPKPLHIHLVRHEEWLKDVIVIDEHAKQEASLSTEHFSRSLIRENIEGTFAKTIENLPGISAINVGVGIAKPVIRGLSSNRIIVNQQGIKQESHQWGADHGLEIDQYDIDRVEIVKGPASLQYGSDGLGGVINVMPGNIPEKNRLIGQVNSIYKTNNNHFGRSALLAANIDDFFGGFRYTKHSFGDYQVPATSFNYNSFILPLPNGSLTNTAGQEENIRATFGIKKSWGITRITYGHYALQSGIFAGAVGVPRSYTIEGDGNNRDIDEPRQDVNHYRFTFNQSIFLAEGHLDINIGYQNNIRQEHSFPEFHSIPSSQIDPNNTLAQQLDLSTWSGNIHLEQHLNESQKLVTGISAQWQDNRRDGFEFLLPDFQLFRGGAFFLFEQKLPEEWTLNGGLRVDLAQNTTSYFNQPVWDSNENIIDSLVAPQTDRSYFNWSSSFGINKQIDDGHWVLKANIGKSFRVPYPSEMVSNGIHHGTFRHEVGTPSIDSEHGYQLDASLTWQWNRFSGSIASYFNLFDNYIYLGPTFPARFSPLPESGQIFQYRQNDAIFTGLEYQWNWQINESLSWEQSFDFVHSYNLDTKLALPFTPQPTLRNAVKYRFGDWTHLANTFIEINHQYSFAASAPYRIDRSEQPTPAFDLWNIGLGTEVRLGNNKIIVNFSVQNLFDTYYLNHMSRYRLINIPEQGRNFIGSLYIPFSTKIKD